MKILTVSDTVVDLIHSPMLAQRFSDVDCILGCGDLNYSYMEYIVTILGKPFYFVYGNHAQHVLITEHGPVSVEPRGCINIHRRVIHHNGLLVAGLEGSMLYNHGPHQYSEREMAWQATLLAPRLLWNTWRYGRPLDILITHAAPLGIHDGQDQCHRGFATFLRFMDRYKPLYLIHGHMHLYRRDAQRVSQYGDTTVINSFGYQIIEIDEDLLAARRSGSRVR
ncbi:MAG: metallophosphoesterase family protein [Anaerolineae bacterium]|nr:metallophosphoesterase family protein [Anaerolineae bacterium]